ncbi:MAG: DUF916 and DUF3324 domain-containing protein [Vagococcus sp.]|uniref:DUF916 and DUF3324 domain-containing protein n=1 Tax=Vagococcus TaxID=2737 RepID=UPI002FC6D252
MNKRKVINYLKLVFGLMIFFSPIAHAEEVDFTVKPEFPENQVASNSGFYDLKVLPGTEQELNLIVHNKSDQAITTKFEINPAATGENGGFIYTLKDSDRDESMKLSISDIASTVDTISIPAKGSGRVIIKLKIPKKPFEGIILGGIRISSISDSENKEKEEANGFSVSNSFAYTIAIRLQENDKLPTSELFLKSVQASQIVGRNSIKATLQNPTPTIIDKVSYHGQVMKKGQDKVLHENKVDGYRIAPNTHFDFPVSWDNQEFKAGTYRYVLKARSEETGKEWKFDQEFTISNKEAKTLNEQAVDVEKDYSSYILLIFLALVIVLLILVIALILKRKKNNKEQVIKKGAHGNRRKKKV